MSSERTFSRRFGVRLAAGAAVAASVAAGAACGPQTANLDFTGGSDAVRQELFDLSYVGERDQTVSTPDWARQAVVTGVGGSGGATCVAGGSGTSVTGTVAVRPGQVFTLGVGGHGEDAAHKAGGPSEVVAPGGWGGLGAHGGAAKMKFTVGWGAGGGGGTSVAIDGEEILTAAGGGGGGMCHDANGGRGGADGPGEEGRPYLSAGGGRGGSFAAMGGRPGQDADSAGGGGGGRAGGGAGHQGSHHAFYEGGAGGGGGGSSWTSDRLRDIRTTTSDNGELRAGSLRITFTAQRQPLSLHLQMSQSVLPVGQRPVLTATLPDDATGHIGFYDHSIPGTDKGIGVAEIVDGKAVLTAPGGTFDVGTHPLSASFGGDDNYAAADSAVASVTVKKEPSVWFQAANSSANNLHWIAYVPSDATGTVTFYDAANFDRPVGAAAIKDGSAVLWKPNSPLFSGEHRIHTHYTGDDKYLPANSNVVVIRI